MPNMDNLKQDLNTLIDKLPTLPHAKWIQRALETIVKLSEQEIERLDWKILSATLFDMERAFTIFYPYRHTRKVTIFGSARISNTTPEYIMASEFAKLITKQGYMVMTGAGGGIMQAGNEGAGAEKSFGLNISLPYEQYANQIVENDPKLITFKYFFTRKLLMLKESDAIAVFPGGFGTQDEVMECLTLCQTGRYGPVPLILIDKSGGEYWQEWQHYIKHHLLDTGLISEEDLNLYTITDNLDVALEKINRFYLVYHSSRYVKNKLIIRLKSDLSDECIGQLNDQFKDIITQGKIEKTSALSEEIGDESFELPRLMLHFNQRHLGRLYQLIEMINSLSCPLPEEIHPEIK